MKNKDFSVERDIAVKNVITLAEDGEEILYIPPWFGMNKCYNYCTGRPLGLINEMMIREEGSYITRNQMEKLGGQMLDGHEWKDYQVQIVGIFSKPLKDKDGNPLLTKDGKQRYGKPYMRYWYEVNTKYTTLPVKRRKAYTPPKKSRTAEKVVQGYLKRSGVKLIHETGNEAYYAPLFDTVVLPKMEQFKGTEEYYSVLFHELGHSTGHKSRLNRVDVHDIQFGSEKYAREELVAELTACILCNYTDTISESSLRNNAAYLKSWAKAIKRDPKMFISASYKADKASQLIIGREYRPIVEKTGMETA